MKIKFKQKKEKEDKCCYIANKSKFRLKKITNKAHTWCTSNLGTLPMRVNINEIKFLTEFIFNVETIFIINLFLGWSFIFNVSIFFSILDPPNWFLPPPHKVADVMIELRLIKYREYNSVNKLKLLSFDWYLHYNKRLYQIWEGIVV